MRESMGLVACSCTCGWASPLRYQTISESRSYPFLFIPDYGIQNSPVPKIESWNQEPIIESTTISTAASKALVSLITGVIS